MHARFYNPQIERFLSFDPVHGIQGVSQSLNRYPYVLGNPLKYTDLWGLSTSNSFDDAPVASFGDSITVTGQSWSIFFSVMGLLAGPGSSGSFGFSFSGATATPPALPTEVNPALSESPARIPKCVEPSSFHYIGPGSLLHRLPEFQDSDYFNLLWYDIDCPTCQGPADVTVASSPKLGVAPAGIRWLYGMMNPAIAFLERPGSGTNLRVGVSVQTRFAGWSGPALFRDLGSFVLVCNDRQ